jgi:hypothetical protein
MIQARPLISITHRSEIEANNYHYLAYSPIDRIFERLSEMEVPGREHIESYIRHKWRMNHRPSTLKGSFVAVSSFLTFLWRQREEAHRGDCEGRSGGICRT